MSEVQKHGFEFEHFIRDEFNCPKQEYTAVWDIPSEYDNNLELPTSVKTTSSSSIPLSGAVRIWKINETFRLIVGLYKQVKDKKNFYEIREYIITPEILDKMRGNVPNEKIHYIHDTLNNFYRKYKELAKQKPSIAKDEILKGRKFHKDYKKQMKENYSSLITLNPKMNKGNGRLQSSITFKKIESLCTPSIRKCNINIISERRRFNG